MWQKRWQACILAISAEQRGHAVEPIPAAPPWCPRTRRALWHGGIYLLRRLRAGRVCAGPRAPRLPNVLNRLRRAPARMAAEARTADRERRTSETEISARVNIDGTGEADVRTGGAFLDHLVASFAKHSMVDVRLEASSLDGIAHHLTEDTAIALGEAIDAALGDRSGIARFGSASAPMDEALASATVDLVRRQYSRVSLGLKGGSVEGMPREDLEHFFGSLLKSMACCAHVDVARGSNDHHRAEAAVKSLALSFRQAAGRDARRTGPPSSKGAM